MQKGIQNDVVVVDFAKAFDKVAHNILLYKLSSYGGKGKHFGIDRLISLWQISEGCPRRIIIFFCSCAFWRPAGLSIGPCIISHLYK